MSDSQPSDPVADQYRGLLLATNMLSVGIDRSRVGILHSAVRRLVELAEAPWSVVGPMPSCCAPVGRSSDLAHALLRTAEEASGFPCGVSGLMHGQGPLRRAFGAPVVVNFSPVTLPVAYQERISDLTSEVRLAAGSGKTAATTFMLIDELVLRVGRAHRRRPTVAELGNIVDAAQALSAQLELLTQRLLTGWVWVAGEVFAVPPTASSPCGLLRLAAPRVPRAPGPIQVPGPTEFALAA
ncbi:hypothetical protein ACFXOI_19850 [Streptomyces bacillaris]|uniref:hypothetical protein n=1 Tax=Streptomyces bacillaris TaxID=68179 RepID=UPI0036C10832